MFLNARYRLRLVLALALGSAITAYAGGFWISTQNPTTVKDPAAKNAVVLVRVDGCHNPADAAVTATAEGLVNGQRRSIPLKLEPVSQPGTYAVAPQWPAGGQMGPQLQRDLYGPRCWRDRMAYARQVPEAIQQVVSG